MTEEPVIAPSGSSLWRRVPRLIIRTFTFVAAGGKEVFALDMVLQTLAGAMTAIQLFLVGDILGAWGARAHHGISADLPTIVLLAAFVGLQYFAATAGASLQYVLAEKVTQHADTALVDASLRVPLASLEDPVHLDQFQRAQVAAGARPYQMTSAVIGLASSLVSFAALAALLIVVTPLLGIAVVILGLPMGVLEVRNSRRGHHILVGLAPHDRRRSHLRNVLVGRGSAAEIRAYRAERFFTEEYEDLWRQRVGEFTVDSRIRLRAAAVVALAETAFFGGVAAVIVTSAGHHSLSIPVAAVALLALIQIAAAIHGIAFGLGQIVQSALFVDDFFAFISEPRATARRAPAEGTPALAPLVTLEVNDVSFCYPHQPKAAVDQISLTLHAGEVIAIVGENGSGKSTLGHLLAGLYRPATGTISWNGNVVDDGTAHALRDEVCVMFQDFGCYSATAAENIALRRVDDARLRDVRRAGDAGGATDVISKLAEGYRTLLGPEFAGGAELSRGEWQRVALSRVLLRRGSLLILDEPTSASDGRAEAELIRRIPLIARDRAAIIISHRLETVRAAQRIIVMHEGRVVEEGRHDELLALEGHYADLFARERATEAEKDQVLSNGAGREPLPPRAL